MANNGIFPISRLISSIRTLDLSGRAGGVATYLHTVAIGPMFVDISAQSVGVETVLECIQDISAASTFCP